MRLGIALMQGGRCSSSGYNGPGSVAKPTTGCDTLHIARLHLSPFCTSSLLCYPLQQLSNVTLRYNLVLMCRMTVLECGVLVLLHNIPKRSCFPHHPISTHTHIPTTQPFLHMHTLTHATSLHLKAAVDPKPAQQPLDALLTTQLHTFAL